MGGYHGHYENFCILCGKRFRVNSMRQAICLACKAKNEKAAAKFEPPPQDIPTKVVYWNGMRFEFRGHCPNANLYH